MSEGFLRWEEQDRELQECQRLSQQVRALLGQVSKHLTSFDTDIAERLKAIEAQLHLNNKNLTRSNASSIQRELKEMYQHLTELQHILERRKFLRQQRQHEIEVIAGQIQRRLQRSKHFRFYRSQLQHLQQGVDRLLQGLSHQDLFQEERYRYYRGQLNKIFQEYDDLYTREISRRLEQELGEVDTAFLSTNELKRKQTQTLHPLELPLPEEKEGESFLQTSVRKRLARLRSFLTDEEFHKLENMTSLQDLNSALLEHEIHLQKLQAEAHALLSTYQDSDLCRPFLQHLRDVLNQQDWAQLRYLIPQIQKRFQDPTWVDALTLEAFFREHLPHYHLYWERPGQVIMVEGDGTQARIRLDPHTHTAFVEPEHETPQFCRSMEILARYAGVTWQAQRGFDRPRTRTLLPGE